MYKIIRKILFLFPTESVHYFSMNVLKMLCSVRVFRDAISRMFTPASLPTILLGMPFRNVVGLAAGFDKNAKYLRELEALGFGFVEIGTVTPLPQEGNPKPRLFRLPEDGALINRMGFNNDGVQVVSERLKLWREKKSGKILVGGNIGKNKVTPNEEAWKDYEICFRALFNWVDYFIVNVSSPNTPGLRALQEKDSLKKILSHLQTINSLEKSGRPILLKIAPDLTPEQLNDVADIANELSLDGLVVANTTISRENLLTNSSHVTEIGAGGLSGRPLLEASTQVLEYLYKKLNRSIPIIASGGIFTAADARQKLNAGASLVQVWTGFIYEGPAIVNNIVNELNKKEVHI